MSDFYEVWKLARQRFLDEISTLNDEQLRWRLHDKSLCIGEMAIHVAAVEISFTSQLLGIELSEGEQRLKLACTNGVINDSPFPYTEREITVKLVFESLETARQMLEPMISNPSPEVLAGELKSALGPIITGLGALTRLSFHPAYHFGQAYQMRTHPGFPN